MKTLTYIGFLFLVGLFSCVEDVQPDLGYIKVIGKQGSSSGNKLLGLPNGDIMIAGKLGVPAFDITQTTDDLLFGRAQDLAPTLVITDKAGNVKQIRSYPIHDLVLNGFVQVSDYEDKASFLDIVPMGDGGYYALGQFSGFTFSVPTEGIVNDNKPTNVSPFLMKLNANLDMEFFRSLNAGPGWDTIFHVMPRIMRLPDPDGSLLVLLGFDNPRPFTDFSKLGFSLLKLDASGDTVSYQNYPYNGVKFSTNMTLDEHNNLVLIGQKDDMLTCFRLPLDSLGSLTFQEDTYKFNAAGAQGFNTNESYIFPVPGNKFFTVFTQPVSEVMVRLLDNSFTPMGSPVDITGNNVSEYPRAATQTNNGDYLIYTEWLDQSELKGFLYRVSQQQQVLWRIPLDGIPGDVMENTDGTILAMSNRTYNNLLLKITLTKLSADGNIF